MPLTSTQSDQETMATTPEEEPIIEFRNVRKRYFGSRDALRGVSFQIAMGEMVFLTGHSGAGKSTLLKLISLVERATRGNVLVDGQDLSELPNRYISRFRRKLGVVYQDHKLLTDRTVFDNVALPLIVSGVAHRELGRRVRPALDKVGLLDKELRLPPELSGGEQQRVGIARAIVNRPLILLADEPTGNLDPELADEIMDLFTLLKEHKTTVIVATHDPRHFRRDVRVLALNDGQLDGMPVPEDL